ncbi:MAG: hypothetical protein ACJ735_13140 [Actinomycetes bacterium]
MTTEPDGTAHRPETGESDVDDAVRALDQLADLPVGEHVAVYDETHRRLQDSLADLDED